ncbi:hypothetical protein GCM10027217_36210 [Pseudomaricurvus hydrocarbonicus]
MGEPLAFNKESKVVGLLPDLILALGAAAGLEVKVHLLPYQRIFTNQQWIHQDLGLTFYTGQQNKAIESRHLTCFQRPLIRIPLYIYGTKPSTRTTPTLATLIPTPLLKEYFKLPSIEGKKLNVKRSPSAEAAFKSLISDRVDYVAASDIVSEYWAAQLPFKPLMVFSKVGVAFGTLCYPKDKYTSGDVRKLDDALLAIPKVDLDVIVAPILARYNLPSTIRSSLLPAD